MQKRLKDPVVRVGNRWGSTRENDLRELGGEVSCGSQCGSFGIMQGHGFACFNC